MKGQLTIFDWLGGYDDRRPCRYRFRRYVGQRVRIMIGSYYDNDIRPATVVKVDDPYYTIVGDDNGREYVGTPYSLSEE